MEQAGATVDQAVLIVERGLDDLVLAALAAGGDGGRLLTHAEHDLADERAVQLTAASLASLTSMEAEGALTLKETDRTTTGDKLLYVLANQETYIVTGKPAKMVEKGCHVNAGTSLSFSKTTDNLRIDGNEETRTQTRTEGKCIEPPKP